MDDTVLHKVWELANFDHDVLDGLTASEYVIAMHLIFRLRGGHALPAQLTVEMVEAARRGLGAVALQQVVERQRG